MKWALIITSTLFLTAQALSQTIESPTPVAPSAEATRAEQGARTSHIYGAPGVVSGNASPGGRASQAIGPAGAPFTTARITPTSGFPFSATGRLVSQKDGVTYPCSAFLVRKGVLVTAAHCVFRWGGGSNGWHTNFVWCPLNGSTAGGPYGCYTARSPRLLFPYFQGVDDCIARWIGCNNDLATLLVEPKNGVYAGEIVGWYSYGWNGYGMRRSKVFGDALVGQVTQLGYPVRFDRGLIMQRNDALAWFYSSGKLQNLQIGSALHGGASGGPWIVNFGERPNVAAGTPLGEDAEQAVIGLTSAMYGSENRMGAVMFGQNDKYPALYGAYGAGNIGHIMTMTCGRHPSYC